jgi:NAD(P)-dependent dehydrogenase (short-subunit alcohol dehydrogenase family)
MRRKSSAGMFLGLSLLAGAAALLRSQQRQQRRTGLKGKTVFITGGSRGLGLALAEEYLREGARVAIAARDREELGRAKSQLETNSKAGQTSGVMTVVCDITRIEDVQAAIEDVTLRLGAIDVLVNNAGLIEVAPFENQPLENFQNALDTNFYGALHTIQAVLPQMAERHDGSIVNICSIGGLVAIPHLLPYTASKFAIVGLSKGLNAELRPMGIRVTTVCPWLMKTGSYEHAVFGGKRDLEYDWFSLGATLPFISVPARVAARQIVDATITGQNELLISKWAVTVAAVAQLMPDLTATLLAVTNRLLPGASPLGKPSRQTRGKEVSGRGTAVPRALGRSAVTQFNQ